MKSERILCGRFKLMKKIGEGSFGQIYSGEDLEDHSRCAVKIEPAKVNGPQLPYEAKLYGIFAGSVNVPRMIYYGTDKIHNVLAMQLCGKSIEDLFVQCRKSFSLKTVLMLAPQMISAVEFIHKKDYIHRDIKPENFVMGRAENANQLYIIDFGLSKRYRDAKTHEHIPFCDNKSLTGTARYASVSVLQGNESSRRDDLESLGYVWLYLLKGTLPWISLTNSEERGGKYDKIRESKAASNIEALCGGLPLEFIEYFEVVRGLKFDEEPKYSLLRDMMRRAFVRSGFIWDEKYDWTDLVRTPRPRARPGSVAIDVPAPRVAEREKPSLLRTTDNFFTRTRVIGKSVNLKEAKKAGGVFSSRRSKGSFV